MVNQENKPTNLAPCLTCRQIYDHALTKTCPYCGQQRDEHGIPVLYQVATPPSDGIPVLPQVAKPPRGGKRPGAGAPRGNLNRLVHGRRSKLIAKGVEKICQDPDLLAVLYLIAAFAESETLPPGTKEVITSIISSTALIPKDRRTNVLIERGKEVHNAVSKMQASQA